MSRPSGRNLPEFQQTQLDFAAHIRDPEANPRPADVEARRMQIYLDLFFNNIESLLASAFPICKDVLGDRWRDTLRRFLAEHGAETPYFLEISQEFLTWVQGSELQPEFLLELAHYEWIELGLDVADDTVPPVEPDGDLMAARPVLNPVFRALGYRWPVHQIGPDHQPTEPPPQPTLLIVYRDGDDRVRFVNSTPATHRLLAILPEADSGEDAVDRLAGDFATMPREQLRDLVSQALEGLRRDGVILGTATDPPPEQQPLNQ